MDTSNNSIITVVATRWPLFHKGRSWPIAIFRGAVGIFYTNPEISGVEIMAGEFYRSRWKKAEGGWLDVMI